MKKKLLLIIFILLIAVSCTSKEPDSEIIVVNGGYQVIFDPSIVEDTTEVQREAMADGVEATLLYLQENGCNFELNKGSISIYDNNLLPEGRRTGSFNTENTGVYIDIKTIGDFVKPEDALKHGLSHEIFHWVSLHLPEKETNIVTGPVTIYAIQGFLAKIEADGERESELGVEYLSHGLEEGLSVYGTKHLFPELHGYNTATYITIGDLFESSVMLAGVSDTMIVTDFCNSDVYGFMEEFNMVGDQMIPPFMNGFQNTYNGAISKEDALFFLTQFIN